MNNFAHTGPPIHTQLPGICDLPGGPQQACEYLGNAASDVANSAFDDLVNTLGDGMAKLLRMVMTWWTHSPSPQLTNSDGSPGPVLAAIRDYTSGLQVLLLTGGLLFAAARLALAKRGGTAGEAQESFLMLGRAVFAGMTFAVVITAGTRAGEQFSTWVIQDASRGDLDGAVANLVSFDLKHGSSLGTGGYLVLFLLGTISMLVQLTMMVIRQALLILVVAVLPIAAAASGTGPGSQSYKRLLSWSLAFLLWKPVGALVYAMSFTVAGRTQDPQMILLGLILLVMTVVVLPALMRLITPAVATLGGGGGGAGAALAGGLAGVAMASVGSGGGAEGRKVAEGEHSPGAAGAGAAPPSPPPPGGDGRGRSMSGDSGDSGGAPPVGGGPGPGSGTPSGGGATPANPPGGAKPSGVAATGGAGEAAATGATGAGMVGAAVSAAGQQTVSAAESQIREATESGGLDPDSLGPGEVRR
ncbi:hypothetical protein [Nocardia brasiliensis]|uniref:hypothetical protein n=1 Tax=Nocardia brasiliensis TaxID=37326 RepID=UPI0004A71D40|nr:hypothetical protein [Nocardia brasiliensis]